MLKHLPTLWLALAASASIFGCENDSDDPATPAAGSGGQATGGGGHTPGGNSSQAGKTSAGSGGAAGGNGSAGSAESGGAAGTSTTGGQGAGGATGESGEGAGGAPTSDVVAECLNVEVGATKIEALRFEGAGLALAIVRRADPDQLGTSGTTPWLGERFGLARGAMAECISEAKALNYTNSHHNFDDEMTAHSGGETWIFKQVREGYTTRATWTVEGRTGAALVWGPVPLTLLSCQNLLTAKSCAESYQ